MDTTATPKAYKVTLHSLSFIHDVMSHTESHIITAPDRSQTMCAELWKHSKAHLISTSRHPESAHVSMPTVKDTEALSGKVSMSTHRTKHSSMIINISYTLSISIGQKS